MAIVPRVKPGLGRRPSPYDARDRQFLMRRRDVAEIDHRLWDCGGPLNQKRTAQCVAYAGWQYLAAGPVVNSHPKHTPEMIYRECLLRDDWPGEDFEGGTSVRALFKVLSGYGYVNGYQWAFDVERVVSYVLSTGPVVVGTSWYRGMSTPNGYSGYLEVSGPNDGGHAWLIIGAYRSKPNPDGSRGAVRMINSWGEKWGQLGRAWITFADLERLIKEKGEACVASEIKISALESRIVMA